ncbi:hypothetical protein DPMN_142548 [Dreissena polymorpha]|uniref:Uncharacterized protein n=1 Tax=Dreissena polymorpha TaxID=45954 RepID=A0A9D4JJ97_DREPO|nr:hypothetical protein DPMN_142548 [Dreissena polymorpha]
MHGAQKRFQSCWQKCSTSTGQILFGTNTILGFKSAMNQVNWLVKVDMKMEQVLHIFMVDLDLDSKNAIVSGQALDMFLKLRAAECDLKAWNHYRKFLLFSE